MNGVMVNNTLSLLKIVSSTQTSPSAIFAYFRLCMDICLDYGYAVDQPLPVIDYLMTLENPLTSLLICFIFLQFEQLVSILVIDRQTNHLSTTMYNVCLEL